MALIFSILLILTAVVLGFFVLIQNPKGGGLASGMGISNQFMGVKQTTDFLEKGTWIALGVLVLFTLCSYIFTKSSKTSNGEVDNIKVVNSNQAGATSNTVGGSTVTPNAADTTKKDTTKK